MKTLMNSFCRALFRACAELVESESGEFVTTRKKSCLLGAMKR